LLLVLVLLVVMVLLLLLLLLPGRRVVLRPAVVAVDFSLLTSGLH
jgi:hypothetical protein